MKKLLNKIKAIDFGTIARTVLQVLAYVNQVVALVGKTSFASSAWYQWTSLIVTILITAVTYWYNNDWSNGALLVRDVFDMFDDGKITKEELEEFVNKHKKKDVE